MEKDSSGFMTIKELNYVILLSKRSSYNLCLPCKICHHLFKTFIVLSKSLNLHTGHLHITPNELL